jgi:hypothetical protein
MTQQAMATWNEKLAAREHPPAPAERPTHRRTSTRYSDVLKNIRIAFGVCTEPAK